MNWKAIGSLLAGVAAGGGVWTVSQLGGTDNGDKIVWAVIGAVGVLVFVLVELNRTRPPN